MDERERRRLAALLQGGSDPYAIDYAPGFEWDAPPSDAEPTMDVPVNVRTDHINPLKFDFSDLYQQGPTTKAKIGQTASGIFTGPNSFVDMTAEQLKSMPETVWNAVDFPAAALRGEIDPLSDEGIGRAMDLAGSVTLGGGAIPAAAGELRAGAGIKPKEYVEGAAIRLPNGNVYRGRSHMEIEIPELPLDADGFMDYPDGTDSGFITNTGRYISRTEASQLANQAGQFDNPSVVQDFRKAQGTVGVEPGNPKYKEYPQALAEEINLPDGGELFANRSEVAGAAALTGDRTRIPYRKDWRGEIEAQYDPQYFDAEPDPLMDAFDPEKVLATKDRLIPKGGDWDQFNLAIEQDPSLMYRGMSAGEYNSLLEQGALQSRGEGNIGDAQAGRTLFTHRPSVAEIYANSFALPEYVPDWDKPAYVVAARKPEDLTPYVLPNGPDEIAMDRPVTRDEIQHAWRGNVVERDYGIDTPGFKRKPSATVKWEQLYANRDPVTGAAITMASGERPTLYSALERGLGKLPLNRATPEQWLATIKNLPGVKQEEVDWRGLSRFLMDQSGPVSRQQIMDHLADNQVNLGFEFKGAGLRPRAENWTKNFQSLMGQTGQDLQAVRTIAEAQGNKDLMMEVDVYQSLVDPDKEFHDLDSAIDFVRDNVAWDEEQLSGMSDQEVYRAAYEHGWRRDFNNSLGGEAEPQYADYVLPGGDRYTEQLITLPPKAKVQGYAIKYKDGTQMGSPYASREEAMAALLDTFPGRDDLEVTTATPQFGPGSDQVSNPDTYQSGHWDEENVLAHMRTTERQIGGANMDWGPIQRKLQRGLPPLSEEQRLVRAKAAARSMGDDWDELSESAQRLYIDSEIPMENHPSTWGSGMADKAVRAGILTPEEAGVLSLGKGWYGNQYTELPSLKGRRTLFAEEMQSDWHQAGAKQGYNQPDVSKPSAEQLRDAYTAAVNNTEATFDRLYREATGYSTAAEYQAHLRSEGLSDSEALAVMQNTRRSLYDTPAMSEARNQQTQALRAYESHKDGIPDAPFKKTWPDLTLKKLVLDAIEGGYDQIAWTDGATQAARYKLSNTFDNVTAYRDENGNFKLSGRGPNDRYSQQLAEGIAPDKLADYVGRDLAEKMQSIGVGGQQSFEGANLSMGGEGMNAFYDRELPNRAKKLFGKYGAKVEAGSTTGRNDGPVSGADIMRANGRDATWFHNLSHSERERLFEEYRTRGNKVWTMQITPELRDAIMQDGGLPMFVNKSPIAGSTPLVGDDREKVARYVTGGRF